MSGLLFLTTEDFVLSKGAKGNIICNTIPGFSLILFYSTQCPHCKNLIPIFKKLPGSISGCQFGMVNISSNKNLIQMSKNTILPINYVPLIILFINSKPYMIYKGPHDGNEIKRFIIEVYQKVNNKQKFSNELQYSSSKKEQQLYKSTPFSEGVPLYGDNEDVSYLSFDDINGYHIPKGNSLSHIKFSDSKGYFK
jgi:thiol-disulfide isomerase/thioredoxin